MLLLICYLGMILFPLGNPIFADLGSAGISMFYVSTIVSQLIFSFGSVFKGGIGSELVSRPLFQAIRKRTGVNTYSHELRSKWCHSSTA